MTKSFVTALALSASVIGLSACMPEQHATDLPPGTYKKETTSTDSQGTTYKSKNETDVSYDEYGNKKAVVKSKTTKDPKGLFNKSTTKSTTVIDEK